MNWEQLKLIFLLRWQLTRNQWTRSRHGLRAIIVVLIATLACLVGAASFLGGLLGAAYGLSNAPAGAIMAVWLVFTAVFLFLWMIGLLAELQRSETIDLQRLMHLPVALGQIFFINYLASHFAFSIVVAVPAAFGLSLGLAAVRGPIMLLLLPLALSMIFMITAWTYCLRGWLAAMMSNPRRRRSIIMIITLAFVLIVQGPNIYFNLLGRAHSRRGGVLHQDLNKIEAVQKFVPPFWVSLGARAIAEGHPLPALLGTVGCFSIGAMGLRRAYRSTLRFYHGETGSKAPAPRVPSHDVTTKGGAATKRVRNSLELRLPLVPEEAAAVALASFRSMLRAPEVKMAWAMSFVVTVILGSSFLFRARTPGIPENLKPFLPPAAIVFSLIILVQFLGNQFGFDRDGFRALVLSPVNRRLILLGKNLATLPVIACSSLVLFLLISVWLRPSVFTTLAGLFQIAVLSIIAHLWGNLLSILVPYRIQSGSMKPTKVPAVAMLVILVCQLLFPVVMFPVFVPPLVELLLRFAGMPAALPVNLILSIVLAMLAAAIYWQALPSLGRLLQRRETKILETVTSEVE